MSLLAGARPKQLSKKVSDPDYLYDLPSHLLFPETLNLEEEEDAHDDTTNHISHATTKHPKQSKHSKSKSTAVPVPSPPPTSSENSGAKLTYDQQIQLVQLQKEKLQLELQVLTLSRRERPQEHMSEGFAEDVPVTESTMQRRSKRSIDWPHNFVPSVQGEYDKLNRSEFVAGFLLMIKTYDGQLKEAFLAHLELLMIKAISYSWSSVRAFHKFVAKQVEQRRLEWQDSKAINDQAATFFRHSDLRSSSHTEVPHQASHTNQSRSSSSTISPPQPAFKPSTAPKACKAWNYTGACDCDKQDSAVYSEHHLCRVCKADHPMLHCPKRRTPIPAQ